MKKAISIILTLIFVFTLSSCWLMEKTIVGEGESVTSEYYVDDATILDIDHINLEDRGNAIYSHLYIFDSENKNEHKVVFEGQQNIIDSINVKSKSGKLTIYGNYYEKYDTDLFAIKLYGFTFEHITLNDVRGNMVSKMKGENVTFDLSGSAYLSGATFETKTLNINLADASSLVLGKVEATTSVIKLLNSSSLSLSSFVSKTSTITLENSSHITGLFDCNVLQLDLSGTSNGTLEGNANKAKIEVSGSSRLNGIGLTGSVVDANILGASTLSIKAVNEIKAYINGDSILTYKGTAKPKIDASGEAIVNYIE